MGRRIFEERHFNVDKKVLSFDEFKPFFDLENGICFDDEQKPRLIEAAEKALERPIPQLYASDYMMFCRNGNRSVFQECYHPRRSMALSLAIGEFIERKGRFTDKLIDVVWLILEETSWVVPAHNWTKEKTTECLPYIYTGDANFIDLFSASTAATLAMVYHMCYDVLSEVTTIITERIVFELDRRIIKPFMNDVDLWNVAGWCGFKGNRVNNWTPWIVSNVLTVAALTVKDLTTRTMVVRRALPMLDSFTAAYHPDGGCDEGPGYWNVAGGALFGACLLLYDMTRGYLNVFDDPLLKNMGEYAVKAVVTKKRSLNFADASSLVTPDSSLLYLWGSYCKSEYMMGYAAWKQDGKLLSLTHDQRQPYREVRLNMLSRLPKDEFKAPKHFYIGGVEIAGSRECEEYEKGLYFALKGGSNGESHNHNDIGNLIVFTDDNPIFLDAGSGAYTKRTFSSERYTIWSMCSDYHNCATFNGVTQKAGKGYCSKNTVYDAETGKVTLDLTSAYPAEAELDAYSRTAVLENGQISVTDDVVFKNEGIVMFSYIVRKQPMSVNESSFIIEGRTVSFDPSLEYAIEELDSTWPEVAVIPERWETDALYRITLSSKSPVKSHKYIMTIK